MNLKALSLSEIYLQISKEYQTINTSTEYLSYLYLALGFSCKYPELNTAILSTIEKLKQDIAGSEGMIIKLEEEEMDRIP